MTRLLRPGQKCNDQNMSNVVSTLYLTCRAYDLHHTEKHTSCILSTHYKWSLCGFAAWGSPPSLLRDVPAVHVQPVFFAICESFTTLDFGSPRPREGGLCYLSHIHSISFALHGLFKGHIQCFACLT